MFEVNDIFAQTAIILFTAALVGFVAVRLKQPLIVAYIAVGILLGPALLGVVQANDQIHLLAQLGIALLLFIVGLKLDLSIIKTMGPVALATGIGQVIFTSLFGYLIALALGFDWIASLYIAVALTFSSTIIIVKLLSDKREVDSLHGRIAVGFLIVQDMLVIAAMIGLNALSGAQVPGHVGPNVIQIALNGILFIVSIGLLMRYVLTPFLFYLSRSRELLLIFTISWAVALAALGHYLGFSKEVGAFVAGVSLASTPYRDVIEAKLTSLRDFLLLFFFVDLGSNLDLLNVGHQIPEALLFSAFVLIGNPIIVMAIMGIMGYRKRTGFLAGLTVAQISEFSLILGALGVSLGHVQQDVLGLITLVGLITISGSTYMILYSHPLYLKLANILSVFERPQAHRESELSETVSTQSYDVIVFGLGRFGKTIAKAFTEKGYKVLGVDFNPEVIRRAQRKGLTVCYGDAEDTEFIQAINLNETRWIIGAIHDNHICALLEKALIDVGFKGISAFAVQDHKHQVSLSSEGALVFIPQEYAAQYLAEQLLSKK